MPKKKPTYTVVVQKWEELERGFGSRPDGWTMHLDADTHREYIEKFYRERNANAGPVPDEYSRPCGTPYEIQVGPKTYAKIKEHGVVWGPGNMPPSGFQGKDGWVGEGSPTLVLSDNVSLPDNLLGD